MTELAKVDKLETVKKTFTKTIEGEQQLASLTPNIGVDQIIGSALFKDKMLLNVEWEVTAGYTIRDILTWDIKISSDGSVSIVLWEPEIFWVSLTGITKSTTLGITTQHDIDIEDTLRQKISELILQDALSGNILQMAKSNAQNVLQALLLHAGIQIKEVIIAWTGTLE